MQDMSTHAEITSLECNTYVKLIGGGTAKRINLSRILGKY